MFVFLYKITNNNSSFDDGDGGAAADDDDNSNNNNLYYTAWVIAKYLLPLISTSLIPLHWI